MDHEDSNTLKNKESEKTMKNSFAKSFFKQREERKWRNGQVFFLRTALKGVIYPIIVNILDYAKKG